MSNKTIFECNACGAEGTIKLKEDDQEVTVCPVCGNVLDLESPDEGWDD